MSQRKLTKVNENSRSQIKLSHRYVTEQSLTMIDDGVLRSVYVVFYLKLHDATSYTLTSTLTPVPICSNKTQETGFK